MHVIIRLAETEKRDRELLIPVADYGDEDASSKPSSSSSSSYRTGRECDPISSSDFLYHVVVKAFWIASSLQYMLNLESTFLLRRILKCIP
ncbi:hypothetical protein ACFX11_026520 [Malus domestica]